jgi:hypothetical protein
MAIWQAVLHLARCAERPMCAARLAELAGLAPVHRPAPASYGS